VEGDAAGITFIFVEGFIGTTGLVIATMCGYGLFELTVSSFFMIQLASICGFLALLCIFISIATGTAGIALSIFNANGAIQTAFSYFVLGQQITNGQTWGIVLALIGACTLSLGEQI